MTPLSPFSAEWPAISALLDEALGLPESAHATWLDGLGGDRAAHREALRTLLNHRPSVQADDFLGEIPKLDIDATDAPAGGLAEGSLVGAYRLIAEIARGGMGTVWLAERWDGTMKRRVAMKLPRRVWGDTFSGRLEREREILAALEHEHISRLYDAGLDEQGRPFLAMEFVEGVPIDDYCRAKALPVPDRIALLLQVMAAVAHAHARLVVHRDLKPGNILVTSTAQVKLLDFGIAKLLEGERTRRTALTELGGRALTLDYASPEQIRGESLGTASDVYSMAVVAYELLAGARPYRLKRDSAAELEEAIATVQPPPASASTSDPGSARQLRGDLDAILNKALKKLPDERYQTMEAFAHDLRRYLAGEPVEARPDGLAYRTAKFVRRHRLQVAAGALAGVALIAGSSIALWQAREAGHAAERAQIEAKRAQVEAATAKAVQGFIESVFDANSRDRADPIAARATTARELLDRGADRIDKELGSEPEARLRLYNLLAEMYAGLGLDERTLVFELRSLDLATRLHGEASDAALSAASGTGQTLDGLGRRDDALAVLLKADAAARSRPVDRDRSRMNIDTGLATVYFTADPPEGLIRARAAAAIARTLDPAQDPQDGIAALFMLGENARKAGHLEEARNALEEAVAWSDRQGVTGVLPDIFASLGEVQDELGLLEPAGVTLARAISLAERIGNPQALHISRYKLARYQYENRLLPEALTTAAAESGWARASGRSQEFGDLPAVVLVNYGRALVAYGDAAGGLVALDEARALLSPQSRDRLGPLLAARADALVSLQRLTEADADVERALAMTSNSGDRTTEAVLSVRRRVWTAAGKAEEALQDLAAHPLRAGDTNTPIKRLWRQAEKATLLLAAGDDAAAQSAAAGVLATIDALPERRFFGVAEARMTAVLGEALLRQERVAEALPVLQEALKLHLMRYDPTRSGATAKVRLALAEAKRRVTSAVSAVDAPRLPSDSRRPAGHRTEAGSS